MFLDRVKIWARAGDGGDGAATFRREAHVPRGGPDGGDGGRGGSVYLAVDAGQTTLRDFQAKRHFKATPGGRGEGSRRHGKAGDDLILDVPPGTARLRRRDRRAHRRPRGRRPAGDDRARRPRRPRQHALQVLDPPGAASTPRRASRATERWLRLELRLIADIGLVGLPNAGKSTLLAALTAAQPKIADYPFTTLEPNLGVMDLGDEDERRPDDRRRAGPDRGRQRGAGPRARVPAPRRADADPRPHRGRLVARPGVGSRGHPRGAAGPRPGPAREADAGRLQQDRRARGPRGVAGLQACPREGRPDGRRHLGGGGRGSRRGSRPARRHAPGRRRARRPARGHGRRHPSHRGDGRRFRGRAPGGTASSASAAHGSSGSPPRRTSTSRSRPSASSATSPASASTTSCAGPGSRPATRSRSARPSSNGRPSPGRAGERHRDLGPAPIVPGSLGIFGGTFDPIHLAHLAVAEAARDALGLERVLFIPVHEPPHKRGQQVTDAAPPARDGRARDRGQPGLRDEPASRSTGRAPRTPSTRSRPRGRREAAVGRI